MESDFAREIQPLQKAGRHPQIVQRLLDVGELPDSIGVSTVVEAISKTFLSSSNQDEIRQAETLMIRFERKGYLNRSDLDTIFNATGDAILNAKGETAFLLGSVLLSSYDESTPESLIRLYARAKTWDAKVVLARFIGAFCKEQGLLSLVDNLYSQKIIRNENIRTILEKHSLLADANLEGEECSKIISAILEYLAIPGPEINSSDDEIKFRVDIINRECAARILVVLNGYSKTSEKSKALIQSNGDLIVSYYCVDRMLDAFLGIPLSRYLSGNVN